VGAPGPEAHRARQPGHCRRCATRGGGAIAELARRVEPPAPRAPVRQQHQRVVVAGRHGHGPRQAGHRHGRVALGGGVGRLREGRGATPGCCGRWWCHPTKTPSGTNRSIPVHPWASPDSRAGRG
jgi:hypothetical protein